MRNSLKNRKVYLKGQRTIPSDTVCYPAKLLHGHVEALVEAGVDAVFYPCMPYNFDEGAGDNNYNCPVYEAVGGNQIVDPVVNFRVHVVGPSGHHQDGPPLPSGLVDVWTRKLTTGSTI